MCWIVGNEAQFKSVDAIVKGKNYFDNRGYVFESYNKGKINTYIKDFSPIQDNESKSDFGVLRGIHFLEGKQQAQLLSVVEGKILDVIVDLRKNSKTFKKWFSIELADKNHYHLYIPRGFGHGFYVLSDKAKINYKTTEYFNKKNEKGIIWNDKDLNIKWPVKNPILSLRDKKLEYLRLSKASPK